MMYLISAVLENAKCLTKQQFLFVALFRFFLTLNIKKIIIINYYLNRPIKLRKQNTAILIVLRENLTLQDINTTPKEPKTQGHPTGNFEKKT